MARQTARQRNLHALTQSAETWAMKFNPAKCYVMSTCLSTKTVLAAVLAVWTRLPGLAISEGLQLQRRVTDTSSKASRTLGFLRRNLGRCPKELKRSAYFWLIRSKMEYAYAVWEPYLMKDKEIINKVQRKRARSVCNEYRRNGSVTEMLEISRMRFTRERKMQISDEHDEKNSWQQGGDQLPGLFDQRKHQDSNN